MQDELIKKCKKRMNKTLKVLKNELKTIRTGRANVDMLDNIQIDYYGQRTPLDQAANINVQDAKTIVVKPFDPSMVDGIEKAILKSDLGLNPIKEKNLVRIPVPSLTEERRKEYVKVAKEYGEKAKIAIRNIRRDIKEEIEEKEKEGDIPEDYEHRMLDELQDITNESTSKIDEMVEKKNQKIMEV